MSPLTDNATTALDKLLSWLAINYTSKTVNYLKQHPNFPSINAFQDLLHEMSINNLVVRLSIDELQDIPFPALAHLNREGGSFVVLKAIHNGQVTYYDSEYGMVTEAQQAFAEKWSGVLLLAEKNAKSGEPNFIQNKRQELFETYSKYGLALLSGCILATVFYFAQVTELVHLVLALSGLGIAFVLLQKQFGASSAWVDSFCKLGNKTNCDEVLNTNYAKVFGLIHLSEVCTWYFSSIVLSLLMGIFTSTHILSVLFIISCLTLPIGILSFYFQGFVIQKWCPLCLAVATILMLDFGSHLLLSKTFIIQLPAIFLVSNCFTALLIPWLLVRKSIFLSFNAEGLQKKILKFTRSTEVFQYLLQRKPAIFVSRLPHEVGTHSKESLIDIVFVTNPTCQPCARAHTILERLAEQFEGKINIIHRFSFNPQTKHLVANKMLQHLLNFLINRGGEEAEKALSDWFKTGEYDLEKWKNKFSSERIDNASEIESLLLSHFQWCQLVVVTRTPTIFINGKELPEQFSVDDLSYHVRKMAENLSLPSPSA